jgi:GDP-4-dehydro-6-deoxy-D-mannose reductase
MKSFITGLTGFVGLHLADALSTCGAEVRGIGLNVDAADARAVSCDILDFEGLRRLVAAWQPDEVYHLAALTHPSRSRSQPREYYLANVQGTVNILEAIRQEAPGARLLLASSAEVYGPRKEACPLSEETAACPRNPYAWTKWISEQVAAQYCSDYGTRVVIARPFNHSGPGQAEGFVVSDFCCRLGRLEQEVGAGAPAPLRMRVGDLSAVRDFLDVRDVIQAYRLLARRGKPGETYNICSGQEVTIRGILDLALELSGLDVEVETAAAGSDPEYLIGDNSKLVGLTGWSPRYSLRETIADSLEFCRRR